MRNLIWVLLSCLLWSGCATNEPINYDRVLDATHRVLERHSLFVQESQYREGTLVAVSKVNGDFLSKSRVKVVARVVEDEEGYAQPTIRVLNQLDNSDVQTWNHPDYQVGERWINVSANAAMEAQLYNEIQQELGRQNNYSGRAWKPVEHNHSNVRPVGMVPLLPYDD